MSAAPEQAEAEPDLEDRVDALEGAIEQLAQRGCGGCGSSTSTGTSILEEVYRTLDVIGYGFLLAVGAIGAYVWARDYGVVR